MPFVVEVILYVLLYVMMIVYNLRAYTYCQSILEPRGNTRRGLVVTSVVNCLLLSLDLFTTVSVVFLFLLTFICLLLQFLLLFQGSLAAFLFSSGTFLFHLMNEKMAVSAIFILTFGSQSQRDFRESILYPGSVLLTLLISLLFLEIFKIMLGRQKIRILLQNSAQLIFVTVSLSLINVYLLILSVSYESQAYSSLAAMFLLCTALLLFGAYYTSFHHAVRMSVLTEYEHKSVALERQLDESHKAMDELRNAALTDTLTAVHNRRYGLAELERLRKAGELFSLCFLDIDHLKHVNDQYGHEEGDRYILAVVRILSARFPPPASLSRMGGDEFLILLPGFSSAQAEKRLNEAAGQVTHIPAVYHPAVSFGIVEVSPDENQPSDVLLHLADTQMYRHKQRHLSS